MREVSDFSFGKFSKVGDRSVITNIGSSLDVGAMIEAGTAQLTENINEINQKISRNAQISQAYTQLSGLVQALQASADVLRGQTSISAGDIDVFDSRVVSATASNGQPASSYINVTAEDGAEIGTFTVSIQATATAMAQQSWYFASNTTSVVSATATTGQFTAGTFSINGVNITLNVGDTIGDVASAINQQSASSNVSAFVIQPVLGQYRLLLQSNLTGVANAYTISDPSNVLNGLFTTNATYDPTPNVQTASDATMTWNSITVTRPLNIITDFMPNITFSLLDSTPTGTTVQVSIEPDTTNIQNAITTFINNYNALINFIDAQQARDENGLYLPTAILQNDPLLNTISRNITPLFMSSVVGLTNLNNLPSIGINYNINTNYVPGQTVAVDDNLSINTTTLSGFLSTNFSDVKDLFTFQFLASSSNLVAGIERGNSLIVNNNSLTFTINVSNPLSTAVMVTYTPLGGGAPVSIYPTFTPTNPSNYTQGGTITGVSGTILDGFVFQYYGTGNETITATFSQGIADLVYNYLSDLENGDTNFLQVQSLLNQSTRNYQMDLSNQQAMLTQKREQLLKKFSKLEVVSVEARKMKMLLEAQQAYARQR